jgi:hypothetical protein
LSVAGILREDFGACVENSDLGTSSSGAELVRARNDIERHQHTFISIAAFY